MIFKLKMELLAFWLKVLQGQTNLIWMEEQAAQQLNYTELAIPTRWSEDYWKAKKKKSLKQSHECHKSVTHSKVVKPDKAFLVISIQFGVEMTRSDKCLVLCRFQVSSKWRKSSIFLIGLRYLFLSKVISWS